MAATVTIPWWADAELASNLIRGLPWQPWLLLLWLPVQVGTLLASMVIADRVAGGIDFGSLSAAVAKGGALILATTALAFIDGGIVLSAPVWFFGLMAAFRLSVSETRLLAAINWGIAGLFKLFWVLWWLT